MNLNLINVVNRALGGTGARTFRTGGYWQDGRIVRPENDHRAWARQVAEDEQVAFVDLYECIAARYDEMGPDAVDAMFADERVHTSFAGASLNAECVFTSLLQLRDPGLRPIFRAARPSADYAPSEDAQ